MQTQVLRYLLFYEGGIFSAQALKIPHIGGYKSYNQYKDNVVNFV